MSIDPASVVCGHPEACTETQCQATATKHPVWRFDGNRGPDDSQPNGWYVGGCLGPFATESEAGAWQYAHEVFGVTTTDDVVFLRDTWAFNVQDEPEPGAYRHDRVLLQIAEEAES